MLQNNQITKIEDSINTFILWLEKNGYESYDQFDFWASGLGIFSKKFFLRNKFLAAPLVISMQLLESFFPRSRIVFAKKCRFAIGDAHFALGFLNLYSFNKDQKYLTMAEELVKEFISYKTTTVNGIGWGYPYTWVTSRAIYPPKTPFITVTPYCFEAVLNLYKVTKKQEYFKILQQIVSFAAADLSENRLKEDVCAAGYGPGDNSRVINANSYRAALLLKAYQLFKINEYQDKAVLNLNYVLQEQQEDGSWDYAPNESFIDNFHTCFVLKNLYKSYKILKDHRLLEAVRKGYAYYREFLFRPDRSPIHFSKIRNPKFRKIEMYDYAEGISLGILLNTDINGALDFSIHLANDLIDKFQLESGNFVTRISTFNIKNKVPYLRWPQAQLFYALTSLLLELSKNQKEFSK